MTIENTHASAARRIKARGFTLIEALVALLVTAFGLLAIAGMQSTMSRNSDAAKQRSEAVRLGQQKMEELRSFESAASAAGKYSYAADVVSSPASAPEVLSPTSGAYTTNTAYTRTWDITKDGTNPATADDLQKWIRVNVTWTDRANQQQTVTLRSVISRSDPVDLGTLFTGPGANKVRTPKNRNINIPYPAVTISDTKSGFVPPGQSGIFYEFDNTSGDVIKLCNGTPTVGFDDTALYDAVRNVTAASWASGVVTITTAVPHGFSAGKSVTVSGLASTSLANGTYTIASVTDTTFTYLLAVAVSPLMPASGTPTATSQVPVCITKKAYLLSGYVRFLNSIPNGAGSDAAISNPTTDTKELTAGVVFPNAPVGQPAAQCFTQRQKVVNAGSITIRDIQAASRTSNVATITTTTNHGFAVGDTVSVNNVSNPIFNGTFVITAKTTSTFSYSLPGANVAAFTTTGKTALVQQLVLAESDAIPPDYNNNPIARFVAYTCVVEGWDDDSNPATPNRWWGQFVITPQTTNGSPWTMSNNGAGNYQMCRYTGDYVNDNKVSNSEHPLHYRGVNGALDNQNYLIIPSNVNCPTDVEATPLTGDYLNVNTRLHQTQSAATGTSPFGGLESDSTAQWSSSGREPNNDKLTVIPML